MPDARSRCRTLAHGAARAALLGFAVGSCATVALASPRRVPTLAAWDRAADASCSTANTAIDELAHVSSVEVEASDLAVMITIGARENTALAAITPPPQQASTIKALLDMSRAGTSLERQLLAALRSAHESTVTSIVNRSATLNNEYNALAVRLGARTCAINPQPGTLHASSLPTA